MNNLFSYAKMFRGIYRLFGDKTDGLPMNHCNDATEHIEASGAEDFPRATPAQAGIRTDGIGSLVDTLAEDNDIRLYGFGMLVDGKIIYESYHESNIPANRHVTFSMSKSIVAMAAGIAIEEKLFDLDTRIYDLFDMKGRFRVKPEMKRVTIRHLLTMQAGVSFDEISSFFSEDWKREYFESSFCFSPGGDFGYNSLNTYILVSAIEKTSNSSFIQFVDKYLLTPMNIGDVTWDLCPHGTPIGGFGMKMSIPDMLKFGWLFLKEGMWEANGIKRRLVPAHWIRECRQCKVLLPEKQMIQGYGYHTWIMWDGSYLFSGMFGQNVYMNPSRNMVIATNASAYEVFPEGKIIERLMAFAGIDLNFKRAFFSAASIKLPRIFNRKKMREERRILRIFTDYRDIEYTFEENCISFVPFFTQVFYSNYMTGIKMLRFLVERSRLSVLIRDSGRDYFLKIGCGNKSYIQQTVEVGGKQYRVSVGCSYESDGPYKDKIKLQIIFPEEVSSQTFYLTFENDRLRIHAVEHPDILRIADVLENERKLYRTRKKKQMKIPEYFRTQLRNRINTEIISDQIP